MLLLSIHEGLHCWKLEFHLNSVKQYSSHTRSSNKVQHRHAETSPCTAVPGPCYQLVTVLYEWWSVFLVCYSSGSFSFYLVNSENKEPDRSFLGWELSDVAISVCSAHLFSLKSIRVREYRRIEKTRLTEVYQ